MSRWRHKKGEKQAAQQLVAVDSSTAKLGCEQTGVKSITQLNMIVTGAHASWRQHNITSIHHLQSLQSSLAWRTNKHKPMHACDVITTTPHYTLGYYYSIGRDQDGIISWLSILNSKRGEDTVFPYVHLMSVYSTTYFPQTDTCSSTQFTECNLMKQMQVCYRH